ncbi:MAG: glutamate-5-semialdehyde dehydrogenase, partial [Lentisphaerae bacterium]
MAQTQVSAAELLAQKSRQSSITLASLSTEVKNAALQAVARALLQEREKIFAANREDCEEAARQGLAAPLQKRLRLDEKKLTTLIDGIESLVHLPDPVGRKLRGTLLDDGLELYQESCPIGVIGIIFESRPDALVQISTLGLKSGNAVILKGGSEAARTNQALFEIIRDASVAAGLPEHWISLIETRAQVREMLALDQYIDLIIPRGSNEFVRMIMDNSRIPVLGHADGICHVYVDEKADIPAAVEIVRDSKCQYVAVCNALETLLVHQAIAPSFLPALAARLEQDHVELRGCPKTREILPAIREATEEDWKTEYLDYILAVKVVDDVQEAIDHINRYGSGHTES